jgi:hypothetical protein
VTALTSSAVGYQTSINDAAAGKESLFSVAPMVSATETQTAILRSELGLQTSQLAAISSNIITLSRTVAGIGGGGGSRNPLSPSLDNF